MRGRASGQAHRRTRAPGGHRRTGELADGGGHAGRTSGRGQRMGGRVDGAADEWTGWRTGRLADGRMGVDRRTTDFEGKTPNLTRQLTWPSEIQRGRPQVTVKLPHLSPPSW